VPPASGPSFGILEFLTIGGIVPLIVIGIFTFYQGIKNTIRVMNDQPYHYPLSIKFVK
ncbi:MAG: DUF4870 domain-containing protein, partial [Gammaproteobacteria bacterium]|nr:DUF4870 domain-containing protein [Gammaproteobacteria bacterium]